MKELESNMGTNLIQVTAADKVHDLKRVAIGNLGRCPGGARDDGAVVFDSDAVLFQAKRGEQILHGCSGCEIRKFARLAVDDEVHALNVAGVWRSKQAAENFLRS